MKTGPFVNSIQVTGTTAGLAPSEPAIVFDPAVFTVTDQPATVLSGFGAQTTGATLIGLSGGSTPDATTIAKGKIQLSGDLAGTAASPSVIKANGATLPGSPSGGDAGKALVVSGAGAYGLSASPVALASAVVPTTRNITATAPIKVNGGSTAALSGDVAVTIVAATTTTPGAITLANDLGGTGISPEVLSVLNGVYKYAVSGSCVGWECTAEVGSSTGSSFGITWGFDPTLIVLKGPITAELVWAVVQTDVCGGPQATFGSVVAGYDTTPSGALVAMTTGSAVVSGNSSYVGAQPTFTAAGNRIVTTFTPHEAAQYVWVASLRVRQSGSS